MSLADLIIAIVAVVGGVLVLGAVGGIAAEVADGIREKRRPARQPTTPASWGYHVMLDADVYLGIAPIHEAAAQEQAINTYLENFAAEVGKAVDAGDPPPGTPADGEFGGAEYVHSCHVGRLRAIGYRVDRPLVLITYMGSY